eukprot:tig00000836_g4702.t1
MAPKEDMGSLGLLTVVALKQRIRDEMGIPPPSRATKNDLVAMLYDHYNGPQAGSSDGRRAGRSPARSRQTESGVSPARSRKTEGTSPARRGRPSQSPARSVSRGRSAPKPSEPVNTPAPGLIFDQVRYNRDSVAPEAPAPARRSSTGRKSAAAAAAEEESEAAASGGSAFDPIFFVKAFVACIVLAVAAVLIYHLAPGMPKPWCNASLKSKDCRPCPAHAKCTNVTFTCESGYVRKRDSCIEDQEISGAAYHLVTSMQSILSAHAGKFKCKLAKNEGMTAAELNAALAARGDDKHPKFKDILEKAKKVIKESSEHDIVISGKASDDTLKFTSTRPRKPVACVIREFLHANRNEVGGTIGAALLFAAVLAVVLSRSARSAEVAAAHKKALAELYKLSQRKEADGSSGAIEAAHLRDQIFESAAAKSRSWARVADALRYDSRVREAVERRRGAEVTIFEWNSSTAPRADELS